MSTEHYKLSLDLQKEYIDKFITKVCKTNGFKKGIAILLRSLHSFKKELLTFSYFYDIIDISRKCDMDKFECRVNYFARFARTYERNKFLTKNEKTHFVFFKPSKK